MVLFTVVGIACLLYLTIQLYRERNVYDREGEREKGAYPRLYNCTSTPTKANQYNNVLTRYNVRIRGIIRTV